MTPCRNVETRIVRIDSFCVDVMTFKILQVFQDIDPLTDVNSKHEDLSGAGSTPKRGSYHPTLNPAWPVESSFSELALSVGCGCKKSR